ALPAPISMALKAPRRLKMARAKWCGWRCWGRMVRATPIRAGRTARFPGRPQHGRQSRPILARLPLDRLGRLVARAPGAVAPFTHRDGDPLGGDVDQVIGIAL